MRYTGMARMLELANWRRLFPLFIVVMVSVACDDRSNQSAPTTSPATPATAPVIGPPTTLTIDGNTVTLPPAKMTITQQGGALNVVLSSVEAWDAGLPSRGNSFSFEMQLDAATIDDVPSISWEFKAKDDQPQDSTDGIFLEGGKRQMQPLDVKVTFQKQGERMQAKLTGKFLSFDPQDATLPTRTADVSGTFDATVEEQN